MPAERAGNVGFEAGSLKRPDMPSVPDAQRRLCKAGAEPPCERRAEDASPPESVSARRDLGPPIGPHLAPYRRADNQDEAEKNPWGHNDTSMCTGAQAYVGTAFSLKQPHDHAIDPGNLEAYLREQAWKSGGYFTRAAGKKIWERDMTVRLLSRPCVALAGAIAAAGCALSSGPVRAAAFQNGSFETGPAVPNPPGFLPIAAGGGNAVAITGWIVYFGSIDYVKQYWPAADGDYSIDVNGNNTGGIYQLFNVNALNDYSLSFSLSGNPAGAPAIKTLSVYACSGPFANLTISKTGVPTNCDTAAANFTYDTATQMNTLANMKWVSESLNFSTKLGSETLFVLSTTPNSLFGPAVDNFVLTDKGEIPEPGSAAIVATGLAAVAGMLWLARRSHEADAGKPDGCV